MPDAKPDAKTTRALQGVARSLSRLGREQARAAGADLTPQQAESLQLLAERGVIRAGMADADATKLAEVGAAKAESHPGVEGDGEGADKIERQTAEGRPKDEL